MSEVTVCTRPEDVTRSSNKAQKRPLSIIKEYDDHDVLTYTAYIAIQDVSCTESGSSCKDDRVSIQNDHVKKREVYAPEIVRKPEVTNALFKFTLNESAGSTNQQLHGSTSPAIPNQNSTADSRPYDDLSENRSAEDKDNGCDSKFESNQRPLATLSLHLVHPEVERSVILHRSEGELSPSGTFQNGENISVDINHTQNVDNSAYDTSNVQEKYNKFCHSPTSSTTTAKSCTNVSPNLSERCQVQTSSSKNVNDVIGSSEQTLPHITVTSEEDTSKIVSLCDFTAPKSDDLTNNNFGKIHTENGGDTTLSQPGTHRPRIYSNSKPNMFGAFFSRRTSTEQIGCVSEGDISDVSGRVSSGRDDILPTSNLSHLRKLQETTEKLQLSTRRPSTMLWRQKYLEGQEFPLVKCSANGDLPDELFTAVRKQRIDEALEWLRNELQEMRSQDQNLARQLLSIRHDLHQLKLQRSTAEHQELIEDFQSELEDLQEFSDILDLPQMLYGDNPLKHIGVTRLNINARRFSAC